MSEQGDYGYLESSQQLVRPANRQWSQHELLAAAEAAKLRMTGWPIGVVLQKSSGMAPIVTEEGIEARMGRYRSGAHEDYWALQREGSYYVSRLLEEDFASPRFTSSEGHPARSIWFDLRIVRVAEVILHSATLYRALDVSPDEPYLLMVNHGGLNDREFYTSTVGRFVTRGRRCRVPEANWVREVTQDLVSTNLKGLVTDVVSGLFVLFDFAEIGQEIVDEVVDQFLSRRV